MGIALDELAVWVDFEKRTDCNAMSDCVEEVYSLLKERSSDKLLRGESENKQLLRHLLVNFLSLYQRSDKLVLTVPFSQEDYPSKLTCKQGTYKKTYVSLQKLKSLRDAMIINEEAPDSLIAYHKGYKDFRSDYGNKVSKLQPLPTLHKILDKHGLLTCTIYKVNHNMIELKNKVKNKDNKTIQEIVPLEKGEISRSEIKEMSNFISSYNKILLKANIQLNLPQSELKSIIKQPMLAKRLPDYSNNQYKRVFSRSSFYKNGRYNSHWVQNLPKRWRPYLSINGNETVEVDFKSCSINILYAQKTGKLCEGDAYDIYEINHFDRDEIIKPIMQTLLNSESEYSAIMSIYSTLRKKTGSTDHNIKNIIDSCLARHSEIEEYFLSDIGIELMNTESMITTKVLSYFISEDIPCLNIHDSFIVESNYEDMLIESMITASREVLSIPLTVDVNK